MAKLSKSVRNRLVAEHRSLLAEGEAEFVEALEMATAALPEECSDRLFPFIIRALWQPYWGCMDWKWWRQSIADRYERFRTEHRWLLENCDVDSPEMSPKGVQALARLLVTVRRKQRHLSPEPRGKKESA